MSIVSGPPAGKALAPTTIIDAAAQATQDSLLTLAKDVLRAEAGAIEALASRLDRTFLDAVAVVEKCTGRVVVTGIGKSGHIARKIAATLASTGTPAFFVHAAEASHGDLGMIRPDDVVIALSNSGETAELVAILALLKRRGAKLVALTGRADSTLGREADVALDASVAAEAGPLALAPTSSTTAALALGDALALALLHLRGFDAEDFARAHPGGALGRKLLVRISDVMCNAAVALWQASATGTPISSANRRSNAFVRSPIVSHFERMTSTSACSSAGPRSGSNNGTRQFVSALAVIVQPRSEEIRRAAIRTRRSRWRSRRDAPCSRPGSCRATPR